MKYQVTVTEHLSTTVLVEAKSKDEAKAIAEKMWMTEEVKLDYDNFSDVTYEAVEVNDNGV